MSDSFNKLYNNEIRAQKLVLIFSLLSFLLADLGLIVFVAFIIRKRTKEITIRKINGARANDIILMLNMNFVRYISYAFIIAIPVSWFILHRWLEQFAYRISLSWWLFILAGVIVLIISMSSIMTQSVRAASVNPVNGLKSN